MIVSSIKTSKVTAGSTTIVKLLDEFLPNIDEDSIVAITSKIVSLCENRAIPLERGDKDQLIKQEADLYLPRETSPSGYSFTITKKTLIPSAGIDESNTDGNYLLWPKDSQATANLVREYLVSRFGLKKTGVIITDSTCSPMRWGTHGIALGHSGFLAVNNYVGTRDLFGREFHVQRSNIAGSLATSATLAMGEGTEQTPIAILSDLAFVEFQDRNPTREELDHYYISHLEDDLFIPFLNSVPWQKGGGGKK